jgi:hypothetical protein
MPTLKSNNPVFVDLFYGVVVGSSISLLSLDNIELLLFQILWIIAVLEDWFLYYRTVVDPDRDAVVWSFRSLMMEFSILLSWYLGFAALGNPGKRELFFCFLSGFYGVKILGGVSFTLKHHRDQDRRTRVCSVLTLYDWIWLLQIVTALVCYRQGSSVAFGSRFYILATVTVASLTGWWLLTSKRPPSYRSHRQIGTSDTSNRQPQ